MTMENQVMQISRKELEERLKHNRNMLGENSNFKIVRKETPGVKSDSQKRDVETQAIIGSLAHVMPRDILAAITDTSPAQVANLANGRPSGYNDGAKEDEALLRKINEKLGKVSDTAIEKLQDALGLIDKEKLHNSKAKELSSIAKDMAFIADKARPTVNEGAGRVPQIIFHAPRFHKEEYYETIQIRENG